MKNSIMKAGQGQGLFDCSGLTAYSGYFRDKNKLLASSSGGAAAVLSEAIIKEGGCVFGACYSSDFRSVEFACIERLEDLNRLKGSKYSDSVKRIFHDGKYTALWPYVSEKLSSGREVLFTGLGCDVAALRAFLRANHIDSANLFTVDLICYGPTLSGVHESFIDSLERKYNSRVKNFTVRHKKFGWVPPYVMAEFENGQEFCMKFYDSDYGKAFGLYARKVCYGCRFRGINHQSDITVGDYWGLRPEMSGYNPDGVSVLIIHNERGRELMDKINKDEFALMPADVSYIIQSNPMYYKPRGKPLDYEKFCGDLKRYGLHKALIIHDGGYLRIYAGKLARLIKSCARKILPSSLKRFIKRTFLHRN